MLALIIPLGMWGLGMPTALYVLVCSVSVAVAADIGRAYSPSFNEWVRWIFGALMRKEELPEHRNRIILNGATCVLIGAFLLAAIFPLRVAVPVLTMTMLADAAAALVGRRLGRHSWGTLSATVEGSAAFLATGMLVMALFPTLAFWPAAASVVVAAVVEALPLPINDNIRVPLSAAAVLVLGEVVFFNQPLDLFAGVSG